jgi:hypothetical protein
LVEPYSINSTYLKKIGNIFHQALVYPWPCRIVRMALAALFLYGGVIKLFDPKAFAATISGYNLAPEALLPFLAVGLPLIEMTEWFHREATFSIQTGKEKNE